MLRGGGAVVARVVSIAALAGAAAHAASPGETVALAATSAVAEYRVVDDGIPAPLAGRSGDPARGRALLLARDAANCVLCHAVPDPAFRAAGDLGPPLAGVGTRYTVAQLRLRIVDSQRQNPNTIMPSYHRVLGLADVAADHRGRPVLSAQEVEDVVAWLATLK